ncbi:MAG: phospholipase D family protein [Pseudomonadota bacterium]|nr:phospholipase D family protein [Pseudomonadota bacterium]
MIRLKLALFLLLALVTCTALWHRYKPLPDGLGHDAPLLPTHGLTLLVDDTWETTAGGRGLRQQIFDEILRLIDQARQLVVLDMFLFNTFGASDRDVRPLSRELTLALVRKQQQHPDLPIILITDPINTLYGGLESDSLSQLRDAGITVVTTPLQRLRDSNPSWSGFWRVCCQWLGNSHDGGWLPNPMGDGKVTLRSYLALLNFKANHRKTLVVDEGDQWTALVTTANPHDASSAHSNLGITFQGPAVNALLDSELAVARLADANLPALPAPPEASDSATPPAQLQVLTEGAIRDALLATIDRSQRGESLDVSVFYLSHRPLVKALLAAHGRGVAVRVLLDPNKDAFGRQKNGIPNRQVGAELHRAGIPVRWCNTRGEQCHTKMLLRRGPTRSELIVGSANFTRRNLDNLNLESSVRVLATTQHPIINDVRAAFLRRWENRHDEKHSTDYAVYADEAGWKYWLYRVMEFTGWSSF